MNAQQFSVIVDCTIRRVGWIDVTYPLPARVEERVFRIKSCRAVKLRSWKEETRKAGSSLLKRGENLRLKRDAARGEKKKRERARDVRSVSIENVALTQHGRREKMFLVNIVLFRRSRDE